MMYPTTANAVYIQTEQIISMTRATLTIVMSDASSIVVTAAQFNDLLNFINANHA